VNIKIIIGSTRQGRVSDRVAKWVAQEASKLQDARVEIIDLKNYELPFWDEPISPQYNPDRKPHDIAVQLLAKLSEGDAYIIVTPEYNRSISGVLKNALDYVDFQFKQKPIAIVAHGSTGGAQAANSLRSILPGLQAVTTPTIVYFIGQAGSVIDEDGNLSNDLKNNPFGPQASLTKLLEELKWYSIALANQRKLG
jgi:NAD(P)H-dependent FMN reductase